MSPSPLDTLPEKTTLFVGGAWREPSSGAHLETRNPTTGEVLAHVADAGADDVESAVHAAGNAKAEWGALPWSRRAARLHRFADALETHRDELAMLDAIDSGNPIAAMRDDVDGAVREVRLFAGLGSELKGATQGNGSAQFAYTRPEPYGVVGRIIPFNHPLKFAAGKIAAPLMAGNAVILKPAEVTSLSAIRMAQLIEDVFPPGVFNLLTGGGTTTGAAIAKHPSIPRVAFTGSVASGRAVLRAGADAIKHVTLELGGKNPMIVFPDADVSRAAAAGIKSMNLARCQGQSCQSTSRIFVHDSIYDPFARAFVTAAEGLNVGDPTREDTDMGPLAFEEHFQRVLGYVDVGRDAGAPLLTGGAPLDRPGYFLPPTVFGEVDNDMTIAQQEIFGPVVSLLRWRDRDEVVAAANDVEYGLTANIWTNDLRQAHRTAHELEAGYVWINGRAKRVPATPFGGYKQSGLGKEGSVEELHEYSRVKVVAVSLDE